MPSQRSGGLVDTETKITAVFVGLALAATDVSTAVTDRGLVQFVVLLGVGVVAPTLVNEWRRQSGPSE